MSLRRAIRNARKGTDYGLGYESSDRKLSTPRKEKESEKLEVGHAPESPQFVAPEG